MQVVPSTATASGHAIGAGPIVLDAIANPFSNEIVTVRGPEGSTIAELLEAAGIKWRRYGGGVCWIEDDARRAEPVAIPRAVWHRVRPKAGTVTTVKLMPGGGQGGGKQILQIVLSIAVMVAAVALGQIYAPTLAGLLNVGTSTAAALITTAIPIVGNLILSAVTPPPAARPQIEARA